MKISELVERLERYRQAHGDLHVLVEGCDCYGEATGLGPGTWSFDRAEERTEVVVVQR